MGGRRSAQGDGKLPARWSDLAHGDGFEDLDKRKSALRGLRQVPARRWWPTRTRT